MIDKVKPYIDSLKGKEVFIKVNVGRNKYEQFMGEILETYPYLFTVQMDNLIKSFTYNDVITKDVQIKIK